MRRSDFCAATLAAAVLLGAPTRGAAQDSGLHILPAPQNVSAVAGCGGYRLDRPLALDRRVDAGAREILAERWGALHLPGVRTARNAAVVETLDRSIAPQGYRLRVRSNGVTIASSDPDGAFYAVTTLAQLARRQGAFWILPCVDVADAPALRWRVLSDDVSRGPLPTMTYFKERIRTVAAFKMNGYSPYMEHVFVSPHDPLPAPLDGITPAQLGELASYARRFHVTFIPEQQTFAHMHNTLAVERYAGLGDLQHDFLLTPATPLSNAYLARILRDELTAVPHPPFFHIGSDETSELGDGRSAPLVAARGKAAVYADHVNAMNAILAPSGTRIMLWDDGIENDPSIMKLIPKNAVIVNWHYGNEKTFMPYIDRIAGGGFDQMVAPGANNWNEIYPDIKSALANESTFVDEGKKAHVFGLFQTVWHDDGESLFESTWYPVLYAAASAWTRAPVSATRFNEDFPYAFFGTSDAGFGRDVTLLGDALTRLTASPYDSTDYLFWADPFDSRIAARMNAADLHTVRLDAEFVETHLLFHTPPLHAATARAMALAARRFDTLGRKYQIASEIRTYYADARAQAGLPHSRTIRDLYWCKYWFWEMRDDYEAIAPLYERAWRYENRPSHLASNLERYHLQAQRAIARADRINTMTYEDYVRAKSFPTLDQVLGLQ